jgi:hypothetical protein
MDPQLREKTNLDSLKKLDPSITDIIATASHASMYQFEPAFIRWKKIECEGPIFIVKRNAVLTSNISVFMGEYLSLL